VANDQIAILGWGSLLWDVQNNQAFDGLHHEWHYDGPIIKLEFSRISQSRNAALTLVVDSQHGSPCKVAWSFSTRNTLPQAKEDLRVREGTNDTMIHSLRTSDTLPKDNDLYQAIQQWATDKSIDYVIWTGLPSNFQNFSLQAAQSHIRRLDAIGRAKTAEYVSNAPSFVQTKLRTLLQTEPGFAPEGETV